MLTYTFSRREKILIAIFSLLLIVVGWYQLVYVTTTDQIHTLEYKIQVVEEDIAAAETKIAKKKEMEQIIAKRIEEGAKTTPIPNYDNIKPLMKELDAIMVQTNNYTLTFESIDTESGEYVLRGVGMNFGADSYEQADKVMRAIVNGRYPCIIDAVDLYSGKMSSSTGNSKFKVYVHVVFYERAPGTIR